MKFGLLSGREDGEYDGVGFVEIFKIFVTYNELFFETISLGGV